MHKIHGRLVHGDVLGTHRSDGGSTRVHAHKVRMDIAMPLEGRRDTQCRVELSAWTVNQHRHLLVRVLAQNIVHVVSIKVPAAHIAFQMKLVFVLCHNRVYYLWQRYAHI